MTYVVSAAILVLLLAGGALAYFRYFRTYHLLTVQEGVLYRTGNRTIREFENTVRAVRPRTVVCLLDANEMADPAKPQFADGEQYLRDNGITMVHVPVRLGGWPTTDDVRRFLAVVEDPANRPVLVHCAQGVRRTGMFVAAYEQSVLNRDDATVRANIADFGHSQRTIRDVQRFIDVYDGPSRSVTAELAPGARRE